MEVSIIIIFCFILPIIVFIKPIIEARKNKITVLEFIKKYKFEILLVFILIFGSFIRLFGIDRLPNALNVDEASSGYDAF